jgi:hypothetical protein
MNKLTICTNYPETVLKLMVRQDLIEQSSVPDNQKMLIIVLDYPNDSLSMEMHYWFALAIGCGLISNYTFKEKD